MKPLDLPSSLLKFGSNLAYYLELDSAVMYVLLARAWRIPASLVTISLISRFLSPELQGYYYTFSAILALGSLLELGLSLVIVNVASNEWASLHLGPDRKIRGDYDASSRLVSLGRFAFKWYCSAAILLFLTLAPIGYFFLSQSAHNQVDWSIPWVAVVITAALSLTLLPFNSILEGCNQVASVNHFRLYQAVTVNLVLWSALILKSDLWVLVLSSSTGLVFNLGFLLSKYKTFFATFLTPPKGPTIDWRTEIWPMQWRIGAGGAVSYLAFSLFTPVMFHYHGPAVAGQMGMTREAISVLEQTAMAWVSTKTPTYGMLISQRRYSELDRLWLRCSAVSLGVIVAGSMAFLGLLLTLRFTGWPLADRLLPPVPTALFLSAAFFTQISQCLSGYLRAHKQEPIVVLSIVTGLGLGLMVWIGGGYLGPSGAAAGALLTWMVNVIWEWSIWKRCRTEWHSDADPRATSPNGTTGK
jgi:O-antigen/teichoic acid export membrane protein